MEKIVAVLTKIKDSQSKFKVKTSKYLKLLDIFKLQLTPDEVKLFLVGNQQLPFGLLYCCGNKSKVDSSLRKSAFYSTELLLSLFERHPQKDLFIKVFTDLDDEDFKQMALSSHIMSDRALKDKGLVAYKIIKHIKDVRPHVDLECILETQTLRDKFNQWYEKERKVQLQQQAAQNTWKEQEALPVQQDINLQREQNKKVRTLSKITMQFDLDPEYLIKTFYNPFGAKPRTTESKKNREAALKKKQIADSLSAVVDEESVEFLRRTVKNLDQVIVRIHLDSPQFDPGLFLKVLQIKVNRGQLEQLSVLNEEMNKNLVYYFIDDFFSINQMVLKIQKDLVGKEYRDIRSKQKDAAAAGKDAQQISQLERQTQEIQSKLNTMVANMNEMRINQQNLRLVLDFLRRSQQYLQMPNQLKEAYLQRDNERIMKLISNLKQFQLTNFSVFQQLNQQIKVITTDIYRDFITQMENLMHDYNQLQLLFQYAIQIQDSKNEIIEHLERALIGSFNKFLSPFSPKQQSTNVDAIQGDLIFEFLQQCSAPQHEDVNLQIVEQFVTRQFKQNYKNYQNLLRTHQIKEPQNLKENVVQQLTNLFTRISTQKGLVQIDLIQSSISTLVALLGPMPTVEDLLKELELKSLLDQFVKITLPRIGVNYKQLPQKDFFGHNYSDFVSLILFEVSKICMNRTITGQYYMNLLFEAFKHLKSLIKDTQDHLVFLHNLTLTMRHLKQNLENVYALTTKQIPFKELYAQATQNNSISQQLYYPVLQEYIKSLTFEAPLPMDTTPRPFISEWLCILNGQAFIMAQLNVDITIIDGLTSYVVQQFFKLAEQLPQKKDKQKLLIQLYQEAALMQSMTVQFQGNSSKEGFQRLFSKIQEYLQEELPEVADWVRQQKYQLSYNFKALCGYY